MTSMRPTPDAYSIARTGSLCRKPNYGHAALRSQSFIFAGVVELLSLGASGRAPMTPSRLTG